tara:strand:- start:113 stop:778 length:666 start_codon:yes stop_codon:yes gene_type:complete
MKNMYNEMRKRRHTDIENGHECSLNLFRQIILTNYSTECCIQFDNIIKKILLFCTNHIGLNPSQYIAHPIRVADLVYQYQYPNCQFYDIELALFHNFLEVSSANFEEAEKILGAKIFREVKILTIDRAKRWDGIYLKEYYNAIEKCPRSTKLIKCCDKMDNLFLLQDNKNTKIQKLYLKEIQNFVLPLANQISENFYLDFCNIFIYVDEIVNKTKQNENKE